MPRRRLGLVLLLPPPVAVEVDVLRLACGDGALGRVPPHVTLVPPVNVREADLPAALAALRAAAASRPGPLRLALGPPATFWPDTPVLHLPVGEGAEEIAALRAAAFVPPLERPVTWPFVPHATLADDAPPERLGAAVVALAGYVREVEVERVHLLEEGPDRRWSPIADAALGPRRVVGRGGYELEVAAVEHLDPEALALVGADAAGPGVVVRHRGAVAGVEVAGRTVVAPDADRWAVEAAAARA